MKKFVKSTKGFTMMEFVVTLAIMGILMSVAVPSFYNVRIQLQERQGVTNMNIIRETFFHYFYQTHMAGNPHFPPTPNNEEKLMDSDWASTPIDSINSPVSPRQLFSNGEMPRNLNRHPFAYETWNDTVRATGEIIYYIKISDVDEDSPSFEKSFTHAI
ncbi:MAG: hypothetical protein CMG57_03755 [Candidatus Marinimicrobia bacterium]|nr:hypothetical protein [Candidatus Neomarinimicrobiota bacterium]|tara:strand:+ start:1466 stop:1942 length:477 start_codon:yes stop_codon:yes gene_type:complete